MEVVEGVAISLVGYGALPEVEAGRVFGLKEKLHTLHLLLLADLYRIQTVALICGKLVATEAVVLHFEDYILG